MPSRWVSRRRKLRSRIRRSRFLLSRKDAAAMLRDYRDWLDSELKLLGNASHHAYSFGQANMAKRALERLDDELGKRVFVPLDRGEAMAVLTALEMLVQQQTSLDPSIQVLRDAIRTAITDQTPPMT